MQPCASQSPGLGPDLGPDQGLTRDLGLVEGWIDIGDLIPGTGEEGITVGHPVPLLQGTRLKSTGPGRDQGHGHHKIVIGGKVMVDIGEMKEEQGKRVCGKKMNGAVVVLNGGNLEKGPNLRKKLNPMICLQKEICQQMIKVQTARSSFMTEEINLRHLKMTVAVQVRCQIVDQEAKIAASMLTSMQRR